MTQSSFTQPNNNLPRQDRINDANAAMHDRLQTRLERLESKSSLLTGIATATTFALLGLLGWSIFQSIEQAKLAERQATIMTVTSDSVDLARLQSLNSDLEELEQRLPEGAVALLEQNKTEIATLKTQLSQVQATAQSAEVQAESQDSGNADAATVASLSNQLQTLNQTIGSLQSKLDAQATQITQLEASKTATPAAAEATPEETSEATPATN